MVTGTQDAQGAQEFDKAFPSKQGKLPERIQSVTDILGSPKLDFYPDLKRIDKNDLIGIHIVLLDARLVREWHGDFGNSDFYLVCFKMADNEDRFTTALSGSVINDQLKKLIERKKLPGKVAATLTPVAGKNNNYYILA